MRNRTVLSHNMNRAMAMIVGLGAFAAALAIGCGDDTDHASGTTQVETGASSTTGSGGTSTGAGGAEAGAMYVRLGGHAGIRAAVEKVLAQEIADPDIASYLGNQLAETTPAGHPNADQVQECFTYQLANVAGGPEAYPTTVSRPSGDWTCRDMVSSHNFLHISGGTFAKFVMIATSELTTLGVSADDVAVIGNALEGTRSAIVDPTLADAGVQPYDAH